MTDESVIITIQDARMVGYCRRGSYELAQAKGLDWSKFLKEGIDSRHLAAPGEDAMVDAIVEQARKRIRGSENGR